jgi:hypothetical protein
MLQIWKATLETYFCGQFVFVFVFVGVCSKWLPVQDSSQISVAQSEVMELECFSFWWILKGNVCANKKKVIIWEGKIFGTWTAACSSFMGVCFAAG